ncbi:MarR family winged helix-turn-helix transcriptional regulator [Leucobacter sp. NPDC015123]|uniref:MarR family winged helix-turn-helix transcriptional regulator n=1 Tax=Leucobacter sp. NPDC015123 TaxID=3364129 RepID=UPI0036F455F1
MTSPPGSQPNQPNQPGLPTTADADALIDALARMRGRRGRRGGHRPGGPGGPGDRHGDFADWGGHEARGVNEHAPPGDAERTGLHPGGAAHREHWGGHGGPPSEGRRGRGGPGGRAGGAALMRMLGVLAHSPEPLSISELAEHIGVDQPRASRLVQQAVALGHAEREADPADARRTRVRLTGAGEQLVHGIRNRQRDEATTALAALDDAERVELLRLVQKLADAWPTP